MSSKSAHGAVYIERPDLLGELLSDEIPKKTSFYGRRSMLNDSYLSSTSRITNDGSLTSKEIQQKLLKEQLVTKSKQLDEITKSNIKNAMQRRIEKNEMKFQKYNNNISDTLKILDVIDKNLQVDYETKKNKVRRQFEDWNSNVHGAIQKNIASKVDTLNSKELNKRKNEDYNKFLDITNRKAAIFRDIIIEAEYDPLEPNRRSIKANVGKLKDPTMIDIQKAEAEGSMLGGKKVKSLLGKDTLDVKLWAAGKIESTPYGTFAKMMGANGANEDVSRSHAKSNPTSKSALFFNDFEFPRTKAAIDAEMPKGKRTFVKKIYSDPGRVFSNMTTDDVRELEAIRNMYLNP